MKIQEPKQKGIFTTTRKALLMATFAIAFSVTPALQSPARADPLDKSSPKIAHGMYHDRGKSSPKIAHTCKVHLEQQKECTGCTVCWFGSGHGRVPDRDNSWTDWLFRMLGY